MQDRHAPPETGALARQLPGVGDTTSSCEQGGAVLQVRATDRMAAIDLPHFCAEAGHHFLAAEENGPVTAYLIERGPSPSR